MGTYKIIIDNEILTAMMNLQKAREYYGDLDKCLHLLSHAYGNIQTAQEEICREEGRNEGRNEG